MFVFHIICTNNIYAYGWFIHMFLFLVTFMHLELLTLFLFFLWDIARRGEYCWCSYEKILYRCWKCVPDVVSPLTRQPFCPISSTVSSKANVAFAANDTHNEKLQKTLVVRQFSIYHYLKDNHSGQWREQNSKGSTYSWPHYTFEIVESYEYVHDSRSCISSLWSLGSRDWIFLWGKKARFCVSIICLFGFPDYIVTLL